MPKKETVEVMRASAQELARKLQEIDPKLFVVLSTGASREVKSLPIVAVSTLPGSVLHSGVLGAAGWEQQSWHDVWKDSKGWTDVWGQSPPPEAVEVAAIVRE